MIFNHLISPYIFILDSLKDLKAIKESKISSKNYA